MQKKKERKVFEDPIKILEDEKKALDEAHGKKPEEKINEGSSTKSSNKKKIKSDRYKSAEKKIDHKRSYPFSEALRLAKETSYASFNATVEVHFNLGLDVSKDEQKVRTTVVLPNGTGKTLRILAFVSLDVAEAVRSAGADLIGDDKKIEEIGRGNIDFDVVVAEPSVMSKLARVAKVLGPKGLMPNPKSGTVSSDPAKAVADLKKGRVELKSETSAPILHSIIGKVSFSEKELTENFDALFTALKAAKPAKTKGDFIQGLSLSATMGPGIRVDLTSIS